MLVINGYRFCQHCVRKVGGSEKAWEHPGIYNIRTGIRHLNPSKRNLSTLCGLDTNSEAWLLPAREHERREKDRWRRWERSRAGKDQNAWLKAHGF